MVSNKTLWHLLAVVGVSSSKYCRGLKGKIFLTLVIILYYISLIHSFVASIRYMIKDNFIAGLSNIVLRVNSHMIWQLMFLKRRQISNVVEQICRYGSRYNMKHESYLTLIGTSIFILFLFSFVVDQILIFTTKESCQIVPLYLGLGYEVPPGPWKIIAYILMNVSQHATSDFPVLFVYCICTVFYKCSRLLRNYNKNLIFHVCCIGNRRNREIFLDFFNIHEVLNQLNHILNYTSLCIIFYSFFRIFLNLYTVIKFREQNTKYLVFQLDVIFGFICGMIILVMYTLCSSTISENMYELRKNVRELVDICVYNDRQKIPQCILQSLERIEKVDIVYISVGGFFHLRRGFILSAIGAIFTYDLLIINLL